MVKCSSCGQEGHNKRSKNCPNKQPEDGGQQNNAATKATPQKPPKAACWRKSREKAVLREAIIMNEITPDMTAEFVFENMHGQIYKAFKFERFKVNFQNLRSSIHKEFEQMKIDCENYGHDKYLIEELRAKRPPEPVPWHRHPAKELLKKDITDGVHLDMDPEYFHASRDEYMDFDLRVFRNHIYQEVDARQKLLAKARMAKKKFRIPRPTDQYGTYML